MAKHECPICGVPNEDNLVMFKHDEFYEANKHLFGFKDMWLRDKAFLICHDCYRKFVASKHIHVLRVEGREFTFREIGEIIASVSDRFEFEEPCRRNCCMSCDHSMYGDAPDGTEVMICFDREGYEGREMIVGDDECCGNYRR